MGTGAGQGGKIGPRVGIFRDAGGPRPEISPRRARPISPGNAVEDDLQVQRGIEVARALGEVVQPEP